MDNNELIQQRAVVASQLQQLLPYINSNDLDNLKIFLINVVNSLPPIEHRAWSAVAALSGHCGRTIGGQYPLNFEQKHGLWKTLIWSVRYAQIYCPGQFAGRFEDLLKCFECYISDREFVIHAIDEVDCLTPYLDNACIEQLKSLLKKAGSFTETSSRGVVERLDTTRSGSMLIIADLSRFLNEKDLHPHPRQREQVLKALIHTMNIPNRPRTLHDVKVRLISQTSLVDSIIQHILRAAVQGGCLFNISRNLQSITAIQRTLIERMYHIWRKWTMKIVCQCY